MEQNRAVSRPQATRLPDTPSLARTRLRAVPAPARLCQIETDVVLIMKRLVVQLQLPLHVLETM